MNQIDATDAKLATHEEICAMRYAQIQRSFESGSKLLGPGFAAELLKKILL